MPPFSHYVDICYASAAHPWAGTHVVYGSSSSDYMTSLIGNRSHAFLENALAVSVRPSDSPAELGSAAVSLGPFGSRYMGATSDVSGKLILLAPLPVYV